MKILNIKNCHIILCRKDLNIYKVMECLIGDSFYRMNQVLNNKDNKTIIAYCYRQDLHSLHINLPVFENIIF